MIIVFTDLFDQSTNDIIDWLDYYNKDFYILSSTDSISIVQLDVTLSTFKININDKDYIDSSEIESFYYRKGFFSLDSNIIIEKDFSSSEKISEYIEEESIKVFEFLFWLLQEKCRYIGNFFSNNPNKLIYLKYALESGLSIPKTLITTSKKELVQFRNNNKNIITKAIGESYIELKNDVLYYGYTSLISDSVLDDSSEKFYESLFQCAIDAEIEIRIFFIFQQLFPTAIIAGRNNKIDYRANYDDIQRILPYKLPEDVEKNLLIFIGKSRLNTGSIDMILDKQGEYYFLEVNPSGQFGYLSYMCNYNLENIIASKFL